MLIPLLRVTLESQDQLPMGRSPLHHSSTQHRFSLKRCSEKLLQMFENMLGLLLQRSKGATCRNAQCPMPFETTVEQQALHHSNSRSLLWVFWLRMEATEIRDDHLCLKTMKCFKANIEFVLTRDYSRPVFLTS